MNFRIIKIQIIANKLLPFLFFITSACRYNSTHTISQASQQLCDCFSKQKTGDIDTRMSPCVDEIANLYGHNKHTFNIINDSDSVIIESKVGSTQAKDLRFIAAVTNNTIVSCDALGSEIEAMYDKWYPVDSSSANMRSIQLASAKLSHITVADTAYKRLLHSLISQNIQARNLELALQSCYKMKKLFPYEGGAYFATAFIYNLQHKYALATNEIKQEMTIENNHDLELILAIIKRKLNNVEANNL